MALPLKSRLLRVVAATALIASTVVWDAEQASAVAPTATADAYSLAQDSTLTIDWWDTDWTRRQKIEFDNSLQGTALTDFPVLVTLTAGTIDYALTQDAGEDLRFLDASGVPLAYEIEVWDELGTSYVWVKVPQIDALSTTDSIWMYYGNAGAADRQDPAGVWSNGYVGVWHLKEDPALGAGALKDSTGYANHGDPFNMDASNLQPGRIGNGLYLAGAAAPNADHLRVASDGADELSITGNQLTLEAWAQQTGNTGSWSVIVGRQLGSTSSDSWTVATKFDDPTKPVAVAPDVLEAPTGTMPASTWRYTVAVRDGGNLTMYSNGNQVAQTTGLGTSISTDANDVLIGASENDATAIPTEPWLGYLDEVRISNVGRSADWVRAQHLSMTGSFTSHSAAEASPAQGGVMDNDVDPEDDPLTAILVSPPSQASLFTFLADGTFAYTPNPGYSGSDSFDYKVNDGADSNTVTVSLTVTPPAFLVNSTADVVDLVPGDGSCDTGNTVGPDPECTLRAAVQEANALAGADTITLPAGTYTLSLGASGEDAAAGGDLDVTSDITIDGAGAATTIIQAGTTNLNGIDRIFEVLGGGGVLDVSHVTLRYGREDDGAAIMSVGDLTVEDAVLTENTGQKVGGAVSIIGSGLNLTIRRVDFVSNAGDDGGAIGVKDATAVVEDSTFSGNTAGRRGGGFHNDSGITTITGSTFSGNSAGTEDGGAILNRGGGANLTVTNSTLSGNSAVRYGGGISVESTTTLLNVTITGNSANNAGGGVRVQSGPLNAKNTIVAGNPTGGNCSNLMTSQGYNLEDTNTCGFTQPGDQVNATALLGPLQDNGGPTDTHGLLAGSDAIDAGTNTGAPATDQRGVARPIDGDGDAIATVDVGAFERDVNGPVPGAIWRQSGQNTPLYSQWNGSSFAGTQNSQAVGEWKVIQGAEAPSRDEAIVLGVDDASGNVTGERWDGAAWSALPINPLGTMSQTFWWGFDVAYEPVSGDAVVVSTDGGNLKSWVWDGAGWTGPSTLTLPVTGTPRHLHLAAHPYADEMVLVVSNANSEDYAYVWNGSSWGNSVVLHSGGSGDRTDVYAAYEHQSGEALVVYGKGGEDVYHQTWNGSVWSGESQYTRPGGASGYARWTTLGSDPATDRIALGVVTDGADVWLAMWDGAGFVDPLVATTSTTGTTEPAVAVAFERTSGEALATYGEASNTPRYRTWTSGSGWDATEQSTPSIGAQPNSQMLYPEPGTDGIMLAVNDASSDLHYLYWNGSTWGPDNELETNTGETKNQPFLFLWEGVAGSPPNNPPSGIALAPATVAENVPVGTAVGTLSTTDPDAGDSHTYTLVAGAGDTHNGLFTIVGDELRTAAGLDYEALGSPLSIRLETTDSGTGNLTFEEVLAVTLTDVNEAPTDIALVPAAVAENVPVGTVVGTLTTTDPDPGDSHTYSLVAGVGDGDNGLFTIAGDELRTAAALDYELLGSPLNIRVQTQDDGVGSLTYEEAMAVVLNDVNEAPVANDGASGAPEDGVVVINVKANDTDAEDGVPGGPAAVVADPAHGTAVANAGGQGTITYTPDPDFYGTDRFTYTIDDSGGLTSNVATVVVTVSGSADPPTATADGPYSVLEDGTLVIGGYDFQFDLEWGSAGSGNGQFTGPRGVAVAPDGSVYVADTANDRIQKFDPSGGYLLQWGTSGTSNGQFDTPFGVAVADDGTVYVVDGFNDRIQYFDANGTYVGQFGGSGTGDGQFDSPRTLDIGPDGNLYVTDTYNHRIQVFTPAGSFLRTWGGFGTGNGQFDAPRGLAVSDLGIVYVADSFNDRVQRFDSFGTYLGQWGGAGTGNGQFDFPRAINIDASGTVYVADSFNNRVQVFDDAGTYLAEFGTSGSGPGQFTNTYGIAFGPGNRLYVVDIGNARIERFDVRGILFNDIDPDLPADTLTASVSSDVSNGTLLLNPDGSFTYDPDPDYFGPDSFVYQVCDTTPTCDTATVTIAVDPVNDEPSFTAGSNVAVFEDNGAATIPGWATAVSAGPANESAQALTFNVTGNTNPGLFAVAPAVDAATGDLTFTPAADLNGVASITIELQDNGGTADGGDDTSASAVFTISVGAVNDEPSFTPGGNVAVDEDSGAYDAVWASAISAGPADESGQTLTFTVTGNTNPGLFAAGPAVNATTGNLSFTPAANANGSADVTVELQDDGGVANGGDDTSTSVVFTITVDAVNDEPSFVPGGNVVVNEDSGAYSAPWASSISPGPANESAQTVSFNITGNTNPGLFSVAPTVDGSGTLMFTTAANANGVASITIEAQDDGGTARGGDDTSAPVVFTITLDPVNDPPTLDPVGNQVIDEGSLLAFTATAADGDDVPPNALTFSLSGAVPAGASITAGGDFTWTPTEAQGPGVYTFDVVVTETDGSPTNLSDSETISVTVNEVNVAPVLDPIGNQSVDEQTSLAFTATASDPDTPANALTFSLSGAVPAGASITAGGDFTWTPTEGQGPGVYVFDVVVTDNGAPNLNDSETISVTVNEINIAPNLDPVGPQAGAEGSSIGFSATASDADVPGNVLTFTLENGPGLVPPGASISPAGVFSWTPTEAQGPGVYTFDVVVTDDGVPALQDRETITVTVSEANNAPAADPIADQNADEGTVVSLTATASDSDVPANTLTWTLDSGLGAVDAAGNYSWTPGEADGPGTYTVVLRVTDSGVPPMFDTVSFDITVNEVNVAPVADPIADQNVDEGSLLSLTATASDSDVPANTLTWSLDSGPGSVSPAGAYSWTPAEVDGPGTYAVVLRVTDDGIPAMFDIVSFDITVNEVNQAPVADPIPDQFPAEGDTVSLAATASDGDVPADTLNWTLDSGPGSVDAAGNYAWVTGEADGPGTYTVVLRVTDDGAPSLSDTVSFDITVAEVNTAPSPDPIGDRFPAEGDTVSLTATATDPDLPANSLTWSKTFGPGSIDAAGNYSWTPSEADGPGLYGVSLQVWDGTAASTVGFSIVVSEVNEAPVLDPIGPQSGNELSAIAFTATATDADLPANGLIFTLQDGLGSVPPGASITSGGSFSWTPSEAQGPGVYSFDVVVTDDGSPPLENRETITVTVDEVDTAPTLDPIGNRSVDEGAVLTFTVTSTDPDVPSARSYSLEDGPGVVPAGAAIDPVLGLFAWPTTEADGPAVYTFDVVVTDNTGLRDAETISISVNERNQAPVLDPIGNRSGDELSAFTFTATATDPDLPPNALTFSLSGSPVGAAISSGGDFSWTPTEAQGPGSYTFDVVVTDDGSPPAEDRETITIIVDEVNEAPVLDPIGDRSVEEENALIFAATASDPDLPANELTFSMTAAPPGASLDAASGLFSWTPDESQGPGSYTVTFRVTDGAGASDQEAVTITVDDVNRAPVIGDPGDQVDGEGLAVELAMVGTDGDVPADTLAWTATGLPDGLTIDPETGSITGVIAVGTAALSPYGVTVTVTDDGAPPLEDSVTFGWVVEANTPPEAAPDFYELAAGAALTVGPPGLLANDSDPDGDPLTVTVIVPPAAGTLSVSSGGGFTYTHNGSNTVEDVFVYQVSDGRGGSALATVKFSLLDPNLPPLLTPDLVVILEDTVGSVLPLGNDSDPNGDALSLLDFTQPEVGTLTAAGDGSLLYVPPENFFGEVTATYRVIDGKGGLATGVISVIVQSVNDVPVGGLDRAILSSYLPITLNVLANDADLDGDALFVSSVGSARHGETVLNADGTVTYRPNRGFVGIDRFTYVLSDVLGALDSVAVSIEIPDNALAAALAQGEKIGSPTLGFQAPPSDLDDGPTESFGLVQGVTLMVDAFFQSLGALRLPILFLGLALGTVVVLGGFTEVPILLATRRRRYYSVVNLDREHRLPVREEPDAESPALFFYEPTAAGFRSLDKPSDDWIAVESPNGNGWVRREYLTEATDLQFFLDDDRPVQMLRRLAGNLTTRDISALFSDRGLAVALTNDPFVVGSAVVQDALSQRPATADGIELRETVLEPLRTALQTAPDLDSRDSHSGTALIPVELWNFQYLAVNAPGHPPWLVYFEYAKGKPKIVGFGVDV